MRMPAAAALLFLLSSFILIGLGGSALPSGSGEEASAMSVPPRGMIAACGDTVKIPAAWPWSRRIAESFIVRHPGFVTYDTGSPSTKWNYEQGLMLVALCRMWRHTGDGRYFDFLRKNVDQYVEENGSIKTYAYHDFNLDNIAPGGALLTLYDSTRSEKYRKAADALRNQLRNQPRTHEGGFWHKEIYPYQMWLDGLYMAEPFYARYARVFNEPDAFDDIVNQFVFVAKHTRDPQTGLFYHGWDESREQPWADQGTGCSATFWGRAIGWYAMALVDVLDFIPKDHPRRMELVKILRDLSESLSKFRDETTGLWYQILDQGGRQGNYLEASASCMFTYAFAKGANRGYLGREFLEAADRSFRGIIEKLVTVDANGFLDLHHTCRGAGLGGNPYRDGSYDYYINEPQRTNDMKGVGPFLLAAIEVEKGISQDTPCHEE